MKFIRASVQCESVDEDPSAGRRDVLYWAIVVFLPPKRAKLRFARIEITRVPGRSRPGEVVLRTEHFGELIAVDYITLGGVCES